MRTRHRSSRPRRTRPHHSTPHDGSGPVADTPDFLDLLAQCPLTHETVALKAGLAWPTAPYRTLGDAYLKVLDEQRRRDEQCKFHILWPAEQFNQLGTQKGRRHAVRTPLGRWVVTLDQLMVDAHLPPTTLTAMMHELQQVETELHNVGSGLEELFIFDALLPLLTMKVWTDRAVRERDTASDEEYQSLMAFFLSSQAQLTSLNTAVKGFLEQDVNRELIRHAEANAASAVGPAFRQWCAAIDLLNDALAMLRPLPQGRSRRIRLATLFQQNIRFPGVPVTGAAPGPGLPVKANKIVDDVLWLAVNILKARHLKLVEHICPLLARTLPLLFPPTVFFPGEHSPFPITALAIQKRYSRLP